MSPIRKVTFLENFNLSTADKQILSKEVVSYLAFLGALKATRKNAIDIWGSEETWEKNDLGFVVFEPDENGVNTGKATNGNFRDEIKRKKCSEKYININLISDIEEIFHDKYIEIYEGFNTDDLNEYTNNYIKQKQQNITIDETILHKERRDFKEKKFNKAEYRPRLFKIKFVTNYSQNSSNLELVIDEASFNEILR